MKIPDGLLDDGLSDIRASIQFLTHLPLTRDVPISGGEVARAAWAFPIVGALVGLIGGVVYALAHKLSVPPWPSAALSIVATLLTTGCLHEGGLAVSVDGFGGGATRERKLEIMHDSRIGTYGVCALVLSILLRTAALASLAQASLVMLALIAAHGAARAALPAFMAMVPPARADGLPVAAGQPSQERVLVAGVFGILLLLLCLGPALGIVALIAILIVIAAMTWLAFSQIDGQTGDVLGALEQACEIVILLAALG